MPVSIQTITATTAAAITPQTFRFNPNNTFLSYSAASVATTARIQMSFDDGATWEPGFPITSNLTTAAGVMFPVTGFPPMMFLKPCLCRLNATVAANYTLKLITLT